VARGDGGGDPRGAPTINQPPIRGRSTQESVRGIKVHQELQEPDYNNYTPSR